MTCCMCGAEFEPRNLKRPPKTCSRACTNKMVWQEKPERRCGPQPQPREIADCLWCGQPVKWAQRPSRQGIYCSRTCTGKAKVKGGITTGQDGRARIVCRDGSRVYYYRAVMEAHLGRPLRPDEVVHHINEDPTDDRLENLEVLTRAAHGRLHHPPGIDPRSSTREAPQGGPQPQWSRRAA